MTITICCSAAFFKDAVSIADQLEKMDHRVLLPYTAKEMARIGDYGVDRIKIWMQDKKDFKKKTTLVNTVYYNRVVDTLTI